MTATGRFEASRVYPGPPVSIRQGVASDSLALFRYKRRVYSETEWLLQAWEDFETDPEREAYFLRRFESSPNSTLLVATDEQNAIVGMVTVMGGPYRRTQHVASIGLGVVRAYWGHGIGSSLMAQALAWAEGNPILEKLTLQVYHTNVRAIQLYKRLGFRQEGYLEREVRLDDGTVVDLIQMSLQLGHSAMPRGENTYR